MRIGLIASSAYISPTIFPNKVFAVRQLVVSLADALVARGHTVTLFSTDDLRTQAVLHTTHAHRVGRPSNMHILSDLRQNSGAARLVFRELAQFELFLVTDAFQQAGAGAFDLLHSFHSFTNFHSLAHSLEDLTGVPTVYTFHNPTPEKTNVDFPVLQRWKNHQFVAISKMQQRTLPSHASMVHNGVDTNIYSFAPSSIHRSAPLLWMGRLQSYKGLDDAIRAALFLRMELKFAPATVNGNGDQEFFDRSVRPHVSNTYIQPTPFVSGKEKVRFLQQAKALLFPIHWDEPFGMVMIEAMACGTPVIAYDRGSVSEIVRDGVTGYIVPEKDGVRGLVRAIKQLNALSRFEYQKMRQACRSHIEANFTAQKMAKGYEQVYHRVLARTRSKSRARA